MAGTGRRSSGHDGSIPAVPVATEIEAARRLLSDHLPVTRLVPAPGLSKRLGSPVLLKLESELPTGSFKPRGALHALLRRQASGSVAEVVASSTGKHGAAVAFAASLTGARATIFLPRDPNPVKRSRIAELGADIVEQGVDLAEAAAAAADYAARRDAYYLDDATDVLVAAGAATIGSEILEQTGPGTIVVPMGDTALIRGVAAAVRAAGAQARIVGVQAATAPSYYLSWKRGEPVATDTCITIADGLATRTPYAPNVHAIRDLVDDVVLVTDEDMIRAIRHLLLVEHVVAEPAGAAATAAVLQLGALDQPAVVLVTGANISPDLLERVAAA
jgi:threonine dehydratase